VSAHSAAGYEYTITIIYVYIYIFLCAVLCRACMYVCVPSITRPPAYLPTYPPTHSLPSTPKWQYIASRRAVPISSPLRS
jgi:hypothetical protein